MPTAKEIYDRKKRLRHERDMRELENDAARQATVDEGEILIASLAVSMERIAAALEKMSQR